MDVQTLALGVEAAWRQVREWCYRGPSSHASCGASSARAASAADQTRGSGSDCTCGHPQTAPGASVPDCCFADCALRTARSSANNAPGLPHRGAWKQVTDASARPPPAWSIGRPCMRAEERARTERPAWPRRSARSPQRGVRKQRVHAPSSASGIDACHAAGRHRGSIPATHHCRPGAPTSCCEPPAVTCTARGHACGAHDVSWDRCSVHTSEGALTHRGARQPPGRCQGPLPGSGGHFPCCNTFHG